MSTHLHILAAVVENKFGVLARVTGLFSRRGFNIFSLSVAPTEDANYSRITIVVDVSDTDVHQISKQLNKLVNVLQISELEPGHSVERELLLARIETTDRAAVDDLLAQFGGSVLDASATEMIVSVAAAPQRIDEFAHQLGRFGITVLQRTGRIALRKLSEPQPPITLGTVLDAR